MGGTLRRHPRNLPQPCITTTAIPEEPTFPTISATALRCCEMLRTLAVRARRNQSFRTFHLDRLVGLQVLGRVSLFARAWKVECRLTEARRTWQARGQTHLYQH